MATISTRFAGIQVRVTRTSDNAWEGVFMPDRPVVARPFDLRSTFVSPCLATLLTAMAGAADSEVNGVFI